MKLSAAEDAIREAKPEVVLQVLLEVWRSNRHPRLSELIERLSIQLTAAKEPITGKTVGQQHEAALALHAKKEPAELGRLLQVRWPGTWQKGVPLLDALLSWPEDPRIEAAIAALLAEPPWDSNASWGFFTRLRTRIDRLSDARVVPALEAAQSRRHPYWYERDFRPQVDAAIKRLRATELALDEETRATLERLESYFAESKAREKDKSRGEAELLADIYARPNDLQARAVFGDWLTERGDPRGELITLQLSSTRTRQQDTRLNALLKAHGSDWAGPLDEWFEPEPRIFEAGFLTGARFLERLPRKLEEGLNVPQWRLIKTLELRRWSADITPLFDVAPLEALHAVEEAHFTQIALGPPRSLVELTTGPWVLDGRLPEQLLGPLPGLPHLRTLGIKATETLLSWMKGSAFFKQLRRLRLFVSGTGTLRGVFDFVRDSLPNITEVELLEGKPDPWMDPGEWRLTFRRSGAGAFTEVEGSWSPGRSSFSVYGLLGLLGFADPKQLTKLELRAARTLKLDASDRKQVDEALAPFSSAIVSVPWEKEAPAKPVKKERTGPTVEVLLKGETLLQPDMEPLWQHLGALGVQFDSYEVGYGNAHRSLGKKPVTTLNKWGANLRCHNLKVYEDGAQEQLRLERPRGDYEAATTMRFHWAEREVEPFVSWLEQLLDRWKINEGAVWSGDDNYLRELIVDSGPPGGWLTVFNEHQQRYLPEKGLKELVARFPGSFTRKTRRNLILGASDSPLKMKPIAQLGKAVNELVVGEFMRVHGVDLMKSAHDAFIGPAKSLGMEPVSSDEERGDRRVSFGKEKFTLIVRMFGFLSGSARIEVRMIGKLDEQELWFPLINEAFAPSTLPQVFATALTNLERDAARWMADPESFYGKKKRR